MPRLLKLMFQVPMSSPQMIRMLGFLSCATAGATNATARSRAAPRATVRVLRDETGVMGSDRPQGLQLDTRGPEHRGFSWSDGGDSCPPPRERARMLSRAPRKRASRNGLGSK